ncbi:uncharacterized protein LOC117646838 [Thrips palmi]|uniref:Uncharacterized protein LOC117646838 n=1 Tax=Thrips palmi TaxID=161013 RepID=A0A6P8ZA51_THRPL|nr:uncharacterized protein LOC117646838 [Thrips palmi]
MFSKTVLVAFVALCCAQAFVSAAPHDEKDIISFSNYQGRSIIKCLSQSYIFAKDSMPIVAGFGKILVNAYTGANACASMDDNAEPPAGAIKACYKNVFDEAVNSLHALREEFRKVIYADAPVIHIIATDCFGLESH